MRIHMKKASLRATDLAHSSLRTRFDCLSQREIRLLSTNNITKNLSWMAWLAQLLACVGHAVSIMGASHFPGVWIATEWRGESSPRREPWGTQSHNSSCVAASEYRLG